jgi:hypothetical protein
MEVIRITTSVDEAMAMTGYQPKTTFWMDFSIADRFGIEAIIDTYERAFKEWHTNHIYLTELVMVLNHKIWQWYEKNDAIARVYDNFGARLMSGRRRTCTERSCNISMR